MANGKKKSRRLLYVLGSATAILLIVIVAMAASHGGAKIDPEKLAKVERGDLAKSVVATGKIEPITKVEIKSKANGIIKALHVDVDSAVNPGDVLVELDKEQLMAALRGAEVAREALSDAAVSGPSGKKTFDVQIDAGKRTPHWEDMGGVNFEDLQREVTKQ